MEEGSVRANFIVSNKLITYRKKNFEFYYKWKDDKCFTLLNVYWSFKILPTDPTEILRSRHFGSRLAAWPTGVTSFRPIWRRAATKKRFSKKATWPALQAQKKKSEAGQTTVSLSVLS